jgi:hypothetical protein
MLILHMYHTLLCVYNGSASGGQLRRGRFYLPLAFFGCIDFSFSIKGGLETGGGGRTFNEEQLTFVCL